VEITTIKLNDTASIKAYVADAAIGYKKYKKRPAIILAPGGAYLIHATREKEGIALDFLAKGYSVFILEYSLGFSSREAKESGLEELDTAARYPEPVLEMMETIHYLKEHSEEFNLDSKRLFMLGFSAGAHVCASCGVFWNSSNFTKKLSFIPTENELKVSGMILCYPLINPSPETTVAINDPNNKDTRLVNEFLYRTQSPSKEQRDAVNLTKWVTSETIPTFIWHSTDDPVVHSVDTTRFVLVLQEHRIDCEYHLFTKGGHGLALANEVYAHNQYDIQPDIAIWTSMAKKWMDDRQR